LERGIEVTQGDIMETKNTDYATLFPDFPPDQLDVLIKAQVAKLRGQNADRRADMRTLTLVDCEARFP
jgi:hypothetical protein